MSWKDYAQPGFVYSTFLMRANSDGVYFNSIKNILSKVKLYLLSIGEEEEEESFWITGRELVTFYVDSKGFQVLTESPLGNLLANTISEEDAEILIKTYHSDKFRDVEDLHIDNKRSFLSSLKNQEFKSADDIIEYIKPLSNRATLYRVHTKQIPYYLEEIRSYGKIKKDYGE